MEERLSEIRDLMVQKGISVFELTTYEWNPTENESDYGNGEYLVRETHNYDQTQFWNLYARQVKLVDGEVRFDLQEVYEDTHDNYDEINWFENEKLEETEFTDSLLTSVLDRMASEL